jgi:glycine/D-amino acid oxidase-like deaminating enzyme
MLSFWEKNSFLKYDYIVIGGGILGLSTACSIKEKYPSAGIVVIERGIFPTGASTKNAGFACFGSLTEILYDIETLGESKAIELVEMRWKGLELLQKRLSGKEMDFLNYGGYELLDSIRLPALDKMEYVNRLLHPIFSKEVFTAADSKISEFGFNSNSVKSLVFSSFESQIDTGLMMKNLIRLAQAKGINIINGCEAADFEEKEGVIRVRAKTAISSEYLIFECSKLIIAANAFSNKIIKDSEVKPGRGHVIVTKPVERLRFKGVFHMDEGFYYFRNYGNRIIFGGGRNLDFKAEETTDFTFNQKILNNLKEKLDNVILPGQHYEIEHQWTGIMGFGVNKLPVIKQKGNVISALSCNGMGIALSSFVAKEIVDIVI